MHMIYTLVIYNTCHDRFSQVWHLGGRLPAALGGLLAGREQRPAPRDAEKPGKILGKNRDVNTRSSWQKPGN